MGHLAIIRRGGVYSCHLGLDDLSFEAPPFTARIGGGDKGGAGGKSIKYARNTIYKIYKKYDIQDIRDRGRDGGISFEAPLHGRLEGGTVALVGRRWEAVPVSSSPRRTSAVSRICGIAAAPGGGLAGGGS